MKLLQKRVLTGCDGSPYLTRWYLIDGRFGGIMLHRFHRSDEDKHLHDHPWNFASVLLWGGYFEEVQCSSLECEWTGFIWRPPFSVLFRRAGFAHAVRLRPGTEGKVWSLVFKGPQVRRWGFHTEGGWVHWKAYLNAKTGGRPC